MGPCEAGWRHNFPAFEQPGLRAARLHLVADELPTLVLPSGLDDRATEAAYACAIVELFMRVYGAAMLGPAIGEWPRIVALVTTGVGGDD